jgi:predicted DNA-binding protein
MATDGRMTIRVNKKVRSKLAQLAKQRGQTESDVARAALEKFVESEKPGETCYDIAKRLGIVGMIKGGPSDMSTNPKYLEGLGRD